MKRTALTIAMALLACPAAMAQEGGIPPHVAQKVGIPAEKVKQVQDLAFAANEELIGLEAEHRKAQLQLERELHAASPDEKKVSVLVDAVGKAETAVRKNRLLLMLKVRKALGEDLWQKLEAFRRDNPPPRHLGRHGPGDVDERPERPERPPGMEGMGPGPGPMGPSGRPGPERGPAPRGP